MCDGCGSSGARELGLAPREVKDLADRAFASKCADFAAQLLERIPLQRAAIDQRIGELQHLRAELDALEEQARHELDCDGSGQLLVACARCPLIDDEGGVFDDRVRVPVRRLPV